MPPYKVLRFLASIDVTIELVIHISFLQNHVSCIFFVLNHAAYGVSRPTAAPLGADAFPIQFLSNVSRRFARQNLPKNPPHRFGLLFVYQHLSIHVIISVWRIADLVGAVSISFLNAPLIVPRNRA